MATSFAQHAASGPLLQELLDAQRVEETAVAYASIETLAESLVSRARNLAAVVCPVGAAAERVAGAATVLAEGDVEVATWNRRFDGECVLLFAVSGVTPLSLAAAA